LSARLEVLQTRWGESATRCFYLYQFLELDTWYRV
jgi:hypothetical protein